MTEESDELSPKDADTVAQSEIENRAVPAFDVEALVLRYRPYLKSLAEAEFPEHLRTRVDDSDLVQETLLKAARQADQFRGSSEAELRAWLREILRNQITDCVRFHGRQQRDITVELSSPVYGLATSDPTASAELRDSESRERIWQAVKELPEDYQTVILLHQQMDLSFVEVAERMQRSPDAVRMLWGRALVMLGEKLKGMK